MIPIKLFSKAWFLFAVFILIVQGCSSAPVKNKSADGKTVETKSSMAVFCKIGENDWRRVAKQDESGVTVSSQPLSFSQVWNVDLETDTPLDGPLEKRKWDDLPIPLPEANIPCIGYALTYPGHQEEVSLDEVLAFDKNACPARAADDIAYRDHLDYEAEIGVLFERGRDDRFGYLIVNDLTDRGIQARTFDSDDMAPGFSKAKSFEGALRVGPLFAVGNEASWHTFQVDLFLNGEVRQRLRTTECVITPRDLVHDLFDEKTESRWILAATGTAQGVLFHSPDFWDKIELFILAGFSMEEATEAWLEKFRFLQPGDEIALVSPTLGRAVARIVKGEQH